MTDTLKVAIAGLGTVGVGVVKILQEHKDLLSARTGKTIEITAVSARSQKDRGIDLSAYQWFDNAADMAAQADADLVVELIGGSEGIAKDCVDAALRAGRHVVTANKALVAHHGHALAVAAESKGLSLNYEAAVAGGIPIIKALREGLAGNGITRVYGILNGTCNYILTTMRETGRDFAGVLQDAQNLGYAEADPTFDVEGIDAAHKLAILASVAFGTKVDFDSLSVEGISAIGAQDIQFAEELGYKIKLLGVANRSGDKIEQRVHPVMVEKSRPIASVEGVFNAVVADGDYVDTVLLEGRGAGEGPTASAVVADIVDIARGISMPTFGIPAGQLASAETASMDERVGGYYVRVMLEDKPGAIADVAGILKTHGISMDNLIQHGQPDEGTGDVPVVFTAHDVVEAKMQAALSEIQDLTYVRERPFMIRIEDF